jgi:predicted dehydrogenase
LKENQMSDKRPVKIGIIGCGMIGNNHLKRYAAMEGAEIVAVCDINRNAAQAAAPEGAEVYEDWNDLLARDDIEAVDVCLHNALHRPATVDALRAGKHVYCEKPIAGSYADGRAMLDAAKEADRMLHVQVGTMFGAENRTAYQVVNSGRLGEIYHGRAYVNLRRRRPYIDGAHTMPFGQKAVADGGALLDWGIYPICQVLWLMGNPTPTTVTGQTYDKLSMPTGRREEAKYDVEELAAGFVRFDNGASLDLLAAWAMHGDYGPGSMILGERAGLSLPALGWGPTNPLRLFEHDSASDVPMTAELDAGWHGRKANIEGFGNAYDHPQTHWLAALRGEVDLLPTRDVALNMTLIAECLYRSAAEGREVGVEAVRSG